jgi:hypothetical protein
MKCSRSRGFTAPALFYAYCPDRFSRNPTSETEPRHNVEFPSTCHAVNRLEGRANLSVEPGLVLYLYAVLVEEAIVDFPGVLCGFGGEARGQAAGRRLPGGLGVCPGRSSRRFSLRGRLCCLRIFLVLLARAHHPAWRSTARCASSPRSHPGSLANPKRRGRGPRRRAETSLVCPSLERRTARVSRELDLSACPSDRP